MPMHEYSCSKCGNEFEELVFDDSPVPCPKCGSTETEKLMSCCRFKTDGPRRIPAANPTANPNPSRSACAGCSGGDCSSCS